jgi:hypothetical protein
MLSSRRLCVLLPVFLSLALSPPAQASTLSGHLTSATGPVAGAFVSATGANGQAVGVSDVNGAYSLTLPDGTYRLAANAPGYTAAVLPAVAVNTVAARDVTLSASGAPLQPLPVFGGSQWGLAADGTPGVTYLDGGNAGQLFRSTDYGGTWTPVTVSRDDAANGLSEAANPQLVTTSGYPGEVAVGIATGPSGASSAVYYSTDYGVTWHVVGNSGQFHGPGMSMMWGHAGARSVLMFVNAGTEWVADMTAASPSFSAMSTPYAPSGQPLAVSDGADQPWLATVDSSGNLSVYPLYAQATAPAAEQTLAGFPANATVMAFGGTSTGSVPPSAVLVGSASAETMSLKTPSAASFPAPDTPAATTCSGTGSAPSAHMAPNSGGSYGAAWDNGCWTQDSGGTVTAQAGFDTGAAIDAGYNSTSSAQGSDAVVLLQNPVGSRGLTKVASTQTGGQAGVPNFQGYQPSTTAQPGTDPGSGGTSVSGFAAANVFQTTFGPAGAAQVASASDAGGFASGDAGASFQIATYDGPRSVAWWQGAGTNTWLLYGLAPVNAGYNLVTALLNWTPSTTPVGGTGSGNVTGSAAGDLNAAGDNTIQSIAGVPGQDTAFLDIAAGHNLAQPRAGVLRRVTVSAGPAFSNVTAIGAGTIVKPGPLAYCPAGSTSASSMQDVLLVIGADSTSGAIYRVSGATGANPSVTKTADLTAYGDGPAISADCASGTVYAASGQFSSDVLKSTDGGASFATLTVSVQGAANSVALTPGDPSSVLLGTNGGFIYSSGDGGQTWVTVNDPSTGQNLSAQANVGGGLWDLAAPPSAGTITGARRAPAGAARVVFGPLSRTSDLVAGPGEFQGMLAVAAPVSVQAAPVVSVTAFSLSNTRFAVTAKATPVSARVAKSKPKRGSAFRYTLTAAATATIVIAEAVPGIVKGKACVALGKHKAPKHAKRCTAYAPILRAIAGIRKGKTCVALGKAKAPRKAKRCTLQVAAGTLTRNSKTGANTVAFSGRIGSAALSPAGYRATITARIGSGPVSNSRSATFTVVHG